MEILSMCLKELNWTCKTTAEVRLHANFLLTFILKFLSQVRFEKQLFSKMNIGPRITYAHKTG